MTGSLLAAVSIGQLGKGLRTQLQQALASVPGYIDKWQHANSEGAWLGPAAPACFLGCGASLASRHEAQLSLGRGRQTSRPGDADWRISPRPQETVRAGQRIGLWIDKERMRPLGSGPCARPPPPRHSSTPDRTRYSKHPCAMAVCRGHFAHSNCRRAPGSSRRAGLRFLPRLLSYCR